MNSKLVYILCDKSVSGIFCYSGIVTVHPICWVGHGRDIRPIESARFMRRIHGIDCKIEVLATGLSYREAVEMEALLTELIGRRIDGSGPLLNIVAGTRVESAAQVAHNRVAFVAANISRRGLPFSETHRQRLSEAARRRVRCKSPAISEGLRRYNEARRSVA